MEERLVRVEEKQTAMTGHIANLTAALQANTALTASIKTKLDELTGIKKFIVWFLGAALLLWTAISTWIGAHKR